MPWASAVLGTHNEPTFSLFLGRLTLHRGSWCWDSRAASFLRWARGRPEPGPGRPTKGEASATCSHWRRWGGAARVILTLSLAEVVTLTPKYLSLGTRAPRGLCSPRVKASAEGETEAHRGERSIRYPTEKQTLNPVWNPGFPNHPLVSTPREVQRGRQFP